MRKTFVLPSALALAACLAGTSLASAQPAPPPPHHHGMDRGDRDGGRHMRGHGRKMGGPDRAMRLARRLSAMETLIGVRSDQLDAWRAFTAASIDMVSRPPRPEPMAEPEAFAMADRMADMAIARAEKAKALKEATAALRQKLDPQQLERVKTLQTEMRDRFMRHHGGGHGDKPGRGPKPDQQRL